MIEPHAEELANLRMFLEGLENGTTKIVRNGTDVTAREARILRAEIAHLEQLIQRFKEMGAK